MARDSTYDLFKKNKSAKIKKIRHFFEFVIIKVFIRFTGLWSIRINQKMGALLGILALRFAKKDLGIANYQIDFCFPELSSEQRKKIVADSFKNLGKTFLETLVIHKFRKNRHKWIHLLNPDVVKKAVADRKGVVMVFGHLGNWELIGIVCEMLEIFGMTVSSPIGEKRLDQILMTNRQSENIKTVQHGNKMTPILISRCFRNNEVLLLAFDQDIRVESVYVDFFGRKASTSKNVARFAQQYEAPVVSAFGNRLDDGTHQYRFELLSKGPYRKGEEEIVELTQLYSRALENHIRNFPSQWAWIHRRWKTQPDPQEET